MRKTYAYNSIIIGFLVGLLVYVSSESLVLGIITCIGISIVGFVIIRALEKLFYKGANAAVDAATKAYLKHKDEKKGGQ